MSSRALKFVTELFWSIDIDRTGKSKFSILKLKGRLVDWILSPAFKFQLCNFPCLGNISLADVISLESPAAELNT